MFFSSPVVWPMFGIWLRHGRRPCCREPWPIRCPLIVTPVLLIACLLLMPFIYYQSLGLLSSLPCRLAFVVRSLAFDRRLLKNVFRLQKCLLALKCLLQLLFNFWHFGLQKKRLDERLFASFDSIRCWEFWCCPTWGLDESHTVFLRRWARNFELGLWSSGTSHHPPRAISNNSAFPRVLRLVRWPASTCSPPSLNIVLLTRTSSWFILPYPRYPELATCSWS